MSQRAATAVHTRWTAPETMRTHIILGCLVVLSIASGCNTVTVREPIGVLAPITDRKALEGAWVNDEGESVQVHLSKSGELSVGSLSWDDEGNRFQAETESIVATKSGDLMLLHMKPEENEPAHLVFCRYEADGQETIRLYLPLVPVFQTAVTAGKLKGYVEKSIWSVDVRIDASSEEVVKFLLDSGAETCFEKKPFMTLKVLKRFK